jgi:ribosomal protein S7
MVSYGVVVTAYETLSFRTNEESSVFVLHTGMENSSPHTLTPKLTRGSSI